MFETNDRDDVGAAFDRVWGTDLAITNGLGRHDNDGMFSFYVGQPAGFQVEVGHGARTITDPWDDNRRYDRISVWGHQPLPQRVSAVPVPMTEIDADVAIVGYGPVGNTLAILLAQRGRSVVVLERWPAALPAPPGRALRPRGRRASSSPAASARACGRSASRPTSTSGATARARRCCASGAGRRPVRVATVVDVQPARARGRCSIGGPASCPASTCVAGSRSPASNGSTDTVVVTGVGRQPRCGPATWSAATVPTARCATWPASPVHDLGFFFDWLIVDVVLDEPRVFDPLNLQVCDPARPDHRGVGRSRSAPLGVHAAPRRDPRRAQRRAAGVGAARAVGRPPRQRPPRAPRRLHVPRPLRRGVAPRAVSCWPATPPT